MFVVACGHVGQDGPTFMIIVKYSIETKLFMGSALHVSNDVLQCTCVHLPSALQVDLNLLPIYNSVGSTTLVLYTAIGIHCNYVIAFVC